MTIAFRPYLLKNQSEECVICLMALAQDSVGHGDAENILHPMCRACALQWFKTIPNRPSCPVCRLEVDNYQSLQTLRERTVLWLRGKIAHSPPMEAWVGAAMALFCQIDINSDRLIELTAICIVIAGLWLGTRAHRYVVMERGETAFLASMCVTMILLNCTGIPAVKVISFR